MDKINGEAGGGGGRQEAGSAGVGQRDGEKRQMTAINKKNFKKQNKNLSPDLYLLSIYFLTRKAVKKNQENNIIDCIT